MAKIRKVTITRSFGSLWIGQSLATFGDVLYIVALIPLIYNVTGSVASTALVPFFASGAQLISGLLAPAVIDRLPLRSMLVYFQSAKTIGLVILTLSVGWLIDHIYWTFIFVTIISFLNGWIGPARSALIPRIVEKTDLVKANGILSTTNQVVYLSGYTLGGVIVAMLQSSIALFLTIALFIISTLLFSFIRVEPIKKKDIHKDKLPWFVRMKEGWAVIAAKPAIRRTMIMDIVETIANGGWTAAIMLVFVQEFLHQDETWWGILNSGYYVGTIAGGFIAIAISKWLRANLGWGMVIGGSLMAVFTAMFAIIPIPIIAVLLCVFMGPAYQMRDIAQITLIQTTVDENKLAKVNAARDTLIYALFGVAVLFMGMIAEQFSVSIAYLTAAALYGVSAILGLGIRNFSSERNQFHSQS